MRRSFQQAGVKLRQPSCASTERQRQQQQQQPGSSSPPIGHNNRRDELRETAVNRLDRVGLCSVERVRKSIGRRRLGCMNRRLAGSGVPNGLDVACLTNQARAVPGFVLALEAAARAARLEVLGASGAQLNHTVSNGREPAG